VEGPHPDTVSDGHDVRHHGEYAVGVGVEKATDFAGTHARVGAFSTAIIARF